MYLTKYRKFASPIPSNKPKNQALRKVLKDSFSFEFSAVSLLAKKSKNAKDKRRLFFKFVLPTYGKLISKGYNYVKTFEYKSSGDGLDEISKKDTNKSPLTIKFRQENGDLVIANVESEDNRVVNFSKNELEKGIYIVIGSHRFTENSKPLVKFLVEKEEILINDTSNKAEICEECEKLSIASTSYYSDVCNENEFEQIESDDDYLSALSHQSSLTQLFVRKSGQKEKKRYKNINTIHTKNFPADSEPSCNYLLKLRNSKNRKINDKINYCFISNESSCVSLTDHTANFDLLIEDRKKLKNERNLTSVSQVLKGVATALKPLQEQLVDLKTKMANFKEYAPKGAFAQESTTKREIQQIVNAIMTADGENGKLPKYFIGNPSYSEPKRKLKNLPPEPTLKKPPYWEPEPYKCQCHMKNQIVHANYYNYEPNFKPIDLEQSKTFNFTPDYNRPITRKRI